MKVVFWFNDDVQLFISNVLAMKGTERETVLRVCLYTAKQTPWLLVRKRTIPTERPSLVGEF
jgi:hypothetical protein